MNDRKVLIASTSRDLKPFRAAAKKAVEQHGWQPAMMESFGAQPGETIAEHCLRRVREVDLVLGIVAFQLGDDPTEEQGGDGERSYTQIELDAAAAERKLLLFLADESWPGNLWESTDARREQVEAWRRGLPNIGKIFQHEKPNVDGELPNFRTLVQSELNRWERDQRPTPIETTEVAQVPWQKPPLPAEPYPLLRPYTHPDLFGGRDDDVERLAQTLARGEPIVALFAESGAGKSSLLQAGLLPRLRGQENPVHPVAYTDVPDSPMLASALLAQLVAPVPSALRLEGPCPNRREQDAFVDLVHGARELYGGPPIFLLDQFEHLWRESEPGEARRRLEEARARVGVYLAASLAAYAGVGEPPCRWVLAYREDRHGKVDAWLRDVLAEARAIDPAAVRSLPERLDQRREAFPLPLFGAAPGRSREAVVQAASERFRAALAKPLEAAWPSGPPLRFAEGSLERLAAAFAQLRVADDQAPLVPELQVVLSHLIRQARENADDPEEPAMLTVPKDGAALAELIQESVRRHLNDALRDAAPGEADAARERRGAILVALRRLANDDGTRGEPLPREALGFASSSSGGDVGSVLRKLAEPQWRVLHQREGTDNTTQVELSHDRIAKAVVDAVDGKLLLADVGQNLLTLRSEVDSASRLYASGSEAAQRQATELSHGQVASVHRHAELLLDRPSRTTWWKAVQERHRSAITSSAPWRAFEALAALGAQGREGPGAHEPELVGVFERGPGDLIKSRDLAEDSSELAEMVLDATMAVVPSFEVGEYPVQLAAAALWLLDRVSAKHPDLRARSSETRSRVLQPLVATLPYELETASIPAGTFRMGVKGELDEQPLRTVSVDSFRLAVTPTTSAQLQALPELCDVLGCTPRGNIPARGEAEEATGGIAELPAVKVSWYQAYVFAAALGGRLPTEAEWEYACRGATDPEQEYWSGNGEKALRRAGWFNGNTKELRPVRQLEPNPFGLYDVHGNVWEWAGDWYAPYRKDDVAAPWGPVGPSPTTGVRVMRGGGWGSGAGGARSAWRGGDFPRYRLNCTGFRVLLPAVPEPIDG